MALDKNRMSRSQQAQSLMAEKMSQMSAVSAHQEQLEEEYDPEKDVMTPEQIERIKSSPKYQEAERRWNNPQTPEDFAANDRFISALLGSIAHERAVRSQGQPYEFDPDLEADVRNEMSADNSSQPSVTDGDDYADRAGPSGYAGYDSRRAFIQDFVNRMSAKQQKAVRSHQEQTEHQGVDVIQAEAPELDEFE